MSGKSRLIQQDFFCGNSASWRQTGYLLKRVKIMQQENRSKGRKWGILLATLVSAFTVILNSSLQNVALPYFMDLFDLSAIGAQWILTTFALSMLVTMTLTSYLGKRYGYKNIFLLGLIILLIGSALGSMAWNYFSVVAARALQGIGGGLIMPLSMVIIRQNFAKNEMGFAMGLWGFAGMVSPMIGPTIGGIILNYSTWRLLFLVNVPVTLLCILATLYYLKNQQRESGEKQAFDWAGFIWITVGLISLVVALEEFGQASGMYASIGLLVLSVAAFYLFAVSSLKKEQPILNLRILKNSVFSSSLLFVAYAASLVTTLSLTIPILVQEVMGLSPFVSGMTTFPHSLTIALFMTVGGKLMDKYGPKYPLYSGAILLIGISLFLTFLLDDLAYWGLIVCLMIFGMGNGLINTPSTTAALNSLDDSEERDGAAILNIARHVAKVFAIVLVSLMFDMRRSYYMARDMGISEAGMSAVQDIFLSIAVLFIVSMPVAWYINKKYRMPQGAP